MSTIRKVIKESSHQESLDSPFPEKNAFEDPGFIFQSVAGSPLIALPKKLRERLDEELRILQGIDFERLVGEHIKSFEKIHAAQFGDDLYEVIFRARKALKRKYKPGFLQRKGITNLHIALVLIIIFVPYIIISTQVGRWNPLAWAAQRGLLFDNSDFERGDLTNWTASGDAFSSQPTYGQTTDARGRGRINIQGNYWVGTFENRRTASSPLGQTQGDLPTGTLISNPFVIKGNAITFLVGAGDGTEVVSVALEVEGKKVLTATNNATETQSEEVREVIWDVSSYKGKTARIIIADNATTGWGHINVDEFKYK